MMGKPISPSEAHEMAMRLSRETDEALRREREQEPNAMTDEQKTESEKFPLDTFNADPEYHMDVTDQLAEARKERDAARHEKDRGDANLRRRAEVTESECAALREEVEGWKGDVQLEREYRCIGIKIARLEAEVACKEEHDALRLRVEALRRLVDQQAEDEGLWFEAETTPEAYLQEKLRHLHASIEDIDAALAAPPPGSEEEGT